MTGPSSEPPGASQKLESLRAQMAEYDLDAYLVLTEDAHNSEYVCKCDERRSYLTGFTGSAGVALVLANTAAATTVPARGGGDGTDDDRGGKNAGTALCWTDSRYFLQASKQLPSEWTLTRMYEEGVPQVEDFLYDELKGRRVGFDPSTFGSSRAGHWRDGWRKKADVVTNTTTATTTTQAEEGNGEKKEEEGNDVPILVPVATNLVDNIWPSALRPPVPQSPLVVHPPQFAGESVTSKLKRVREALKAEGNADGMVVSALDQNAWLFNLRGDDIECNPVFFSYGVVTVDDGEGEGRGGGGGGAHLFLGRRTGLDGDWIGGEVSDHLKESGVTLHPYSTFGLDAISKIFPSGGRVLVERTSCSVAVADAVSNSPGCSYIETSESAGPVELFKSRKNAAEIRGIRQCSIRDSAAIVMFAAWLDERMSVPDEEGRGDMSESGLAAKLLEYRRGTEGFLGNSFPTISSVGPNSAIVHYCPEPGSDSELTLKPGDIYLLDSGGHYVDGTTDVTRTFHFGGGSAAGGTSPPPPREAVRYYTRVLQGHVALARATFPEGTPGLVLDCYARSPLWRDGLTYGHGTGHGIGARLNVHEGPAGIGGGNQPGNVIRANPRMTGLYLQPVVEGMYLSNEPGYYEEGRFGFRVECDVVAVDAAAGGGDGDDEEDGEGKKKSFGGGGGGSKKKFLKFDTVTKVPMCRSLVDTDLLTAEEKEWLNDYHADCRETLLPHLEGDDRARKWLEKETVPII